ncbi:alpha-1,4-glucan--maltose-1-phosphate maltosyltransferase [Streptomyces sp. DSM 44917]|uniref:Alpha-1,4-glucan:maltose-1-phosphate maltosyltransferase n=1 Tax=Streptomyces boetiae TaxID=3075541 RepID=A0ABU2L4Y7_9ACTN|nr:alpha-1,4-glucan--maltose-1-phosphate maltosyltransferase [Streptomyces sp. DSM 44917]MDT0306632.1 alpha-1,4-glucan--maltose-1-phosphate maltosyltransferase [Streptomyces sp. DSM 44917]
MSGRLVISDLAPVVSGGCHPAKAVIGEHIPVGATIWREGHEALSAHVVWRPAAPPGAAPDAEPVTVPMILVNPGLDRWEAHVVPDREGLWTYQVVAWSDPWTSWRRAVEAKAAARVPEELLANDLESGARLLDRLAAATGDPAAARAAARLRAAHLPLVERLAGARAPETDALARAHPLRELVTEGPVHEVWADRTRALFGSWYELFPRSTGGVDDAGNPVHGTFATAAADLPRVAAMGFDVVYVPPVHPIGRTHRKGRNNALTAEPGDVGSPWAIGSEDGGHDAVHPDLGTVEDFEDFVRAARDNDLEIALDLALQCSPDHPWASEHPEWFTRQPDGSIAYAENPPKRYEDIYPLNFDNDPGGLSAEVLRIVLFWVERGVRIFRVDNPHTKPPGLWLDLIRRVKESHPDVLFLAEAFTRPAVLQGLAKAGFTQSYTYFTWRTGKAELTDYARELAEGADFLRPNLFVNTPDILPEHLQHGGPAMFALRAALAATLSPTWGVYSGYELYEHRAVREGSEEYLDSEKYQLRPRDWAAAEAGGRSLAPWLTRLNAARRAHPALQQLRRIQFLEVDNDALLAYVKTDPATGEAVLCLVTLNAAGVEEGTVLGAPAAMGAGEGETLALADALGGGDVLVGPRAHVKIDPREAVARVLVRRGHE